MSEVFNVGKGGKRKKRYYGLVMRKDDEKVTVKYTDGQRRRRTLRWMIEKTEIVTKNAQQINNKIHKKKNDGEVIDEKEDEKEDIEEEKDEEEK